MMKPWLSSRPYCSVWAPVQQGFSVVELMVSVAISIILLLGMIQMLVNNQNTYRLQTGLALLQENGRFGMDFLATDVRLAGNQGCAPMTWHSGSPPIATVLPSTSDPLLSFTPATIVVGYEAAYERADLDSLPAATANDWIPNLPASLVALNPVRGSDIIEVRYVDSDAVSVSEDVLANNTIVLANNINDIQVNDIVVISDCKSFDSQSTLFRVSGVAGTTLSHDSTYNTTSDLKRDYFQLHSPEVGHLQVNIYFVENTNRPNEAGLNILALSRYTLLGGSSFSTGTLVKEELLTGVENLQIQYGLGVPTASNTSSHARVNRYATADELGANPDPVDSNNPWATVITARIALLANTVENMGLKPESYTFEGASHTPLAAKDYLLRREFVSTAAIRQRTRELKN